MVCNTVLTDNFNPNFHFTVQDTKPRCIALATVCI